MESMIARKEAPVTASVFPTTTAATPGGAGGVRANCTKCGTMTIISHEAAAHQLQQRSGIGVGVIETYCVMCSSLQSHTLLQQQQILDSSPIPHHHAGGEAVAGRTPPSAAGDPVQRSNSVASSSAPRGNPHHHQQQQSHRSEENDDSLWRRLTIRVNDNGLSMKDVLRVGVDSQRRLFVTLGFTEYEAERLTVISQLQDRPAEYNAVATTGDGGSGNSAGVRAPPHLKEGSPAKHAPIEDQTHRYAAFRDGNEPQHHHPAVPSYQRPTQVGGGSPSAAAPPPPPPPPHQDPSPIRGLSYDGSRVIARCSVYPELPAEFWCCACNVLVSSRCHVQGVHKDHPFITMRLAAEAHVRDVASWTERCRTQLNVTESVLSNLQHADELLAQGSSRQFQALDEYSDQIIKDLLTWKEQLKADIQAQIRGQEHSMNAALQHTRNLHKAFSQQLQSALPLMANVPPIDQSDAAADDWALRVLDFVSKLKLLNLEPIPMPKAFIPEVRCFSTPSTHMELLKVVSQPISVRLPDVVDPGYFAFPQPTASVRVPFSLNIPANAQSKGIVVYNGRTLTRAQDIVPAHSLVSGSQVFYTGTVSWEVHVDRVGPEPCRILAGVVLHGSDGAGVVWDGQRIVGPNEGECRVLDTKYQIRSGTVLRFVLELNSPACYLNCYFDKEVVAKVPLPATGNGWVPSFSVLGPQDQLTVVPTSSSNRAAESMVLNQATMGMTTGGVEGSSSQAAKDVNSTMSRQEHLIASLQQQLSAVNSRIDQEQYKQSIMDAGARGVGATTPAGTNMNGYGGGPGAAGDGTYSRGFMPPRSRSREGGGGNEGAVNVLRPSENVAAATAQSVSSGRYGGVPVQQHLVMNSNNNLSREGSTPRPTPSGPLASAYSPELKLLMKAAGDF